jgi:S1-C subfamily serine protease
MELVGGHSLKGQGQPRTAVGRESAFAAGLLFVVAILGPSPVAADTMGGGGTLPCSPEGFSASSVGLSEAMLDAWRATVLIEGEAIVRQSHDDPRVRTNRGSGVVVRFNDSSRTAIVVTNAHVLRCREQTCIPQVGFSVRENPDRHVWSSETRIVWSEISRDLAFVEARVPPDAEVRELRLAASDCIGAEAPDVVAIGWPDLRVRTSWGVEPPDNAADHVKRFSIGKFLTALGSYRPRPQTKNQMERMSVLFHNADVLPGSSGGALVNTRGELLGINTHVVGDTDRSVHNQYCARREDHGMGEGCVHLAIASSEVVELYRRVFSSDIKLASCETQREGDDSQRVAELNLDAN